MSLDDHLCPDKDIGPVIRKGLKDLAVALLAPGGIGVHSKDPGMGKSLRNDGFHLLGTQLHGADKGTAAVRTGFYHRCGKSAIMADETIPSVMS